MLTSVYPTVTARGAFTAVGVGIDGNNHAGLQTFRHVLSYADNLGTYLVTRHYGHLYHGVATTEGVEVATAETYILHLQ